MYVVAVIASAGPGVIEPVHQAAYQGPTHPAEPGAESGVLPGSHVGISPGQQVPIGHAQVQGAQQRVGIRQVGVGCCLTEPLI